MTTTRTDSSLAMASSVDCSSVSNASESELYCFGRFSVTVAIPPASWRNRTGSSLACSAVAVAGIENSPLEGVRSANYRRCGDAFVGPERLRTRTSGVQVFRLRPVGLPVQEALEGDRAQRSAEQETLDFVATVGVQEFELGHGFYALGDDFEFHVVRHRDDAARNRRVVAIVRQVADERTVDLDAIDREALEIGQRSRTRAEIVDRDAHAGIAPRLQQLDRSLCAPHHHAFGNLEFHVLRRN